MINLEKQIKRHVIGPAHLFFAVTAPGLEELCAGELPALSPTIALQSRLPGGVSFSGRLDDLYRANLWLRTAGRVLMRIDEFSATNFRKLEKKTAALCWAWYLPQGAVPACKVSTHRSRLYHTAAVEQAVQRGVRDYWQAQGIPVKEEKQQTLYVRLQQDSVLFSLDSSGPNLHRRGLKTHAGAAPLRETLAAAVLLLAGYDPRRPLLDPMCGSGTFALEAALLCKNIAPGQAREFAFFDWPSFRPARFQHLKKLAAQQVQRLEEPLIYASDVDPEAIGPLGACIERSGLADAVAVRRADFFSLYPPSGELGLIVLNPPYGLRLTAGPELKRFYRRIGEKLAGDFKGWQTAWIIPSADLLPALPRGLKPIPLHSGGLKLTLLVGRI